MPSQSSNEPNVAPVAAHKNLDANDHHAANQQSFAELGAQNTRATTKNARVQVQGVIGISNQDGKWAAFFTDLQLAGPGRDTPEQAQKDLEYVQQSPPEGALHALDKLWQATKQAFGHNAQTQSATLEKSADAKQPMGRRRHSCKGPPRMADSGQGGASSSKATPVKPKARLAKGGTGKKMSKPATLPGSTNCDACVSVLLNSSCEVPGATSSANCDASVLLNSSCEAYNLGHDKADASGGTSARCRPTRKRPRDELQGSSSSEMASPSEKGRAAAEPALRKLEIAMPLQHQFRQLQQRIEELPEKHWTKKSSASYRRCDAIHFGLGPACFPDQTPRGSRELKELQSEINRLAIAAEPDLRFSSIIINRYKPEPEKSSMGLHSDRNLPGHPWQLVCVWGDFRGGVLRCEDNFLSECTDGVWLLNGNIEHQVFTVTEGIRYSLITYCKNLSDRTPARRVEELRQWGFPLPEIGGNTAIQGTVALPQGRIAKKDA